MGSIWDPCGTRNLFCGTRHYLRKSFHRPVNPIFFSAIHCLSLTVASLSPLSIDTTFVPLFPMKNLSPSIHQNILSALNSGRSYRQIAREIGISKTSVQRIANSHSGYTPRNTPGRPKGLSIQDRRRVVRLVTSGQADTAPEVAKTLSSEGVATVNPETVRRVLREEGFRAAPKTKKPLLLKRHQRARLEFAKRHQHWTTDDWRRVVWSDETKINRFGSDGRKWHWKTARRGISANSVQPTVKFGGGSIMIWVCMTAKGVGHMARIENGLDSDLYSEILKDELMETLKYYGLSKDRVIFQQDNDPKHTSKRATQTLKELSLEVLKWPAQSPDLNPIEHLWDALKRKLADYPTQPTGILELWDRVQNAWDSIEVETCTNLIDSMPRRIEAVLKARGGYTDF